jgi:hypothetical protein
MGTLGRQHRPEENMESVELNPSSNPIDSSESEERGPQKAYVAAEKRWLKAMQGAIFEESRQAQKSEPIFRRRSPMQYGHGSSLL